MTTRTFHTVIFLFALTLAFIVSCNDGDDDDDDESSAGDDADDDIGGDDDSDDDIADDDDDAGDDDASGGMVDDPQQSECLSSLAKDESDYTFDESLVIDYADGALQFEHLNTCRNCDFEFEGSFSVEGLTITVTEKDIEPLTALCDCPYNISYVVDGLTAGVYTLVINKVDEKDYSDPTPVQIFEGTMDLVAQNHFQFDIGEQMCI